MPAMPWVFLDFPCTLDQPEFELHRAATPANDEFSFSIHTALDRVLVIIFAWACNLFCQCRSKEAV